MLNQPIEVIQSLVSISFILFLSFLILTIIQVYIKTANRNKILKFTKQDIDDRRKEIDILLDEINNFKNDHERNHLSWRVKNNQEFDNFIKIFSIYNTFAVGINEGIYDEIYVKIVLKDEMTDFYNRYFHSLDTDRFYKRFVPLERLLKKWASENPVHMNTKKNRR